MHRHGLLVGVFLSLVLATPNALPSIDNAPSSPNLKAGSNSKLSTTCYLGEPSETCIFTCNQQSMEAYCDEEKKQCVCKTSENKTETNPENKTIEETKQPTSTEITPTEVTTARPQTNFKLSDFCMFGYPTPACILNCKSKKMKGYCDDELGLCVCRKPPLDGVISMDWLGLLGSLQGLQAGMPVKAKDLLDLSGGASLDLLNLLRQLQTDDSKNLQESLEAVPEVESNLNEVDTNDMVYYVFDLEALIRTNASESTKGTNTTASTPGPSLYDFPDVGKAIEGLDVHHVLAIITLVFIGGLVLLEISYCFKKPKTNSQMQSIFPSKK